MREPHAPFIGRPLAIGSIVLALALTGTASDPKFYPDDPLIVDNDTMDTPGQPAAVELSDLYDRFGHIFATPGSSELLEALNVNTLDEVPNSSWFTNRHGHERMRSQRSCEASTLVKARISANPGEYSRARARA